MARLLAALGCLCILLARGHAAAVPTQDTMVVSRADDTTPTESSASEVTSEGPLLPIKLTEMDVRSEVSLRYAHTAVVAYIKNPAHRAQEASFRVLLPETAFISGFVMTLDGKSYKAYVKEKAEAAQIYNDAVSHGIGAAHVATKARDSNHFTVTVNIEGNTSAVFNLTYEELLSRKNGVYNHAINLHPGGQVPKLTVTVHIKETQKITDLRVPEIRTGNEIDATKDDAQNSKAVIVRSADNSEATITFTPDLDEQQRLISVYKEKTKEERIPDEDDTQGVLGQFVVQYDVDHSKSGEVMVNNGYFVHFFAPTDLPPLSKHVVFVLDTSGSMMGRKIQQLREAMQIILSELYAGDFFSIVEFDSSVQVHDLKEADEEPKEKRYTYDYNTFSSAKLIPPSEATPENIAKAKVIVSRLSANGGTNIYSALDVATKLAQMGVGWSQPVNYTASAAPASPLAKSIDENHTPKEDTSVADVDDDKKLEPIIIFLTDGDATVGETRSSVIIKHLTEKNYGDKKATIFSLAFGEDADRKFLRKLSLRNDGFMRHIYEAADAALQLRHFYKQVSSPLLSHVNFTYPAEQIKMDTLTKRSFRSYFSGSELVVAGHILDTTTELSPRLEGFCGVLHDGAIDESDKSRGRKRYQNTANVPVEQGKNSYLPLERIWAYLTIKQLLDEKDAREGEIIDKETSPEKKALDLALKYSFVTPLTSLVVVKPNDTKAVDAQSVDEPHAEYHDALSNAAFSHSLPSSLTSSFASHSALSAGLYPAARPVGGAPLGLAADIMYDYAIEEEEGNMQYSLIRDPARPSPFKSSMRNDYGFLNMHSKHNNIVHLTASSGGTGVRVVPVYSTTPSSLSLLTPYHLDAYKWAITLLNSIRDTFEMLINGTAVSLKLTKDSEPPKRSEGDEACTKAVTSGSEGVCVYLTRCSAALNIQAAQYEESYCSVNGYAGVCCPQDKVNN